MFSSNMESYKFSSAILVLIVVCCCFTTAYDGVLRIFGGNDAERDQFRYQVLINYKFINTTTGTLTLKSCGGSILSYEWILTAAHCTIGREAQHFKIIAGILNQDDNESNFGKQIRIPEKIVNHNLYKKTESDEYGGYDISLIKLKSPLEPSASIETIKIPRQNEAFTGTATVSGWGITNDDPDPNTLQYADVTVISGKECNERLAALDFNVDPNLNICSIPKTEKKESFCHGDSGGPLAADGKVIGIVHGKVANSSIESPSIYVSTAAYSSWILEHTDGAVTLE